MSFERPAFLFLLALAPAAVFLALRSRSSLRRGRILASLSLRALALLALALGLAGMGLAGHKRDVTVFLFDSSASVLLAQQVGQAEWTRAAVEAAGPDQLAAAVQFADGARIAALPTRAAGDPIQFLNFDPTLSAAATSYQAAIEAGLALIGTEGTGRLVLLSDGEPNSGNLEEALGAAKARGIPIFVAPSTNVGSADVALESVIAPPTVRAGQAFEVRVVAVTRRRTEARLRLWAGNELIADNAVELEAGSNPFSVRVPGRSPGFERLRAELLEDADSQLGNNVLETYTQVLPPARVLIVGDAADTAVPAAVLREAGLAVSVGSAASLPSDYLRLAGYETVLLANVPAKALSEGQLMALRDHVTLAGRGLIVAGGDKSFGPGEYADTVLDEILPVRSNPPEEEQKGLALVLVIDRSTSMAYESAGVSKLEMAKEAAVQAVGLLKEGDRIGVIAFHDTAAWLVAPRQIETAADLRDIVARIRRMELGGGTDIYTALQTARQRVRAMDAGVKHVILITDGQATYGDFDLLARQARRDGISVSTIGIGQDADQKLLEKIARDSEGRHYYAAEPASIPAVLTKETQLAQSFYMVNRRHQPRLQAPSPIFHGATPDASMPYLGGFVRTKAKPTAEIVLASDSNDPILATWQLGLGRVIAWTSDLGGEWGAEWRSWPEFASVLTGMVAWVSAGAGASDWGLRVGTRLEGGRARIVVDSVDSEGRFRNALPTKAAISPPAGSPFTVQLDQTGPGRYEGVFDARGAGLYRVVVTQQDGAVTIGPQDAGFVDPYSPELRIHGAGPSVLRYIAQATGGKVLSDPAEAIPAAPLGRPESLVPLLVTLGMLLFLLDVGMRRVRTGRRELREQYDDVRAWLDRHRPRELIVGAIRLLRRRIPLLG